jgi:opacity protein-like surface antigen
MKITKIFIVALVAMTTTSNLNAQVFEEGNVSIDLYYGFPNLYTTVFKSAYANSGTEQDIEIGGIGPVGLRGEYLLTDKIGLGLDLGFNNSNISYTEATTDNNGNPVTYDYNYSTQKIGAMVTFNYHFIDNDQLDFYGVFGMGYGNRSFKFESTDPNYTEATVSSIIPVASRLGVGMRYFFSDYIGANLALGFGQGGIINAGLSFKL